MNSSDSSNSSINDKDIFIIEDDHFNSENQLANRLNETYQNKCVADKNELKKILQTVYASEIVASPDRNKNVIETISSDCVGDDIEIVRIHDKNKGTNEFMDSDSNGVEIVRNHEKNKGINQPMNSDFDDVEIVNVVVYPISSQENNFGEPSVTSVNNQPQNSSADITVVEHIDQKKDNVKSNIFLPNITKHVKSGSNKFVEEPNIMDVDIDFDKKESPLYNDTPEACVVRSLVGIIEMNDQECSEDNAMCESANLSTETNSYIVEYNFKNTPTQISGAWKEFTSGKNNYTRGCKWAPDGSCILTCSDDNKLRIFNLPPQVWDTSQWCDISEMDAVLKITEGDLIYDYCWYPLMNSNDASTCCFVSSSRKSTIHLWDAYTGELRCSYRSFNHLDDLVTPYSLSFDSDGEKVFCGYRNAIRIFDVNRPGRYCEERKIYSHKNGQCGIISCFAFTPADKNISAAGSYSKTIGLYAEPNGEFLCLLEGQANGITQLMFSPDGNYLYSGGRKDPDILCWDIRNLGEVLFSLPRSCATNQRMYFDVSRDGRYIVSGNQNGVISFWDVTKEPAIIHKDFPVLKPILFYLAHKDCVNGVSLHPSYPLLCSSSGQRKFPILLDDTSEEIFSSETEKQDNSLRLWWIGNLNK